MLYDIYTLLFFPILVKMVFFSYHIFRDGFFNACVQGYFVIVCNKRDLSVKLRIDPHIESPFIFLFRTLPHLSAKRDIVINRLMKLSHNVCRAFSLKIHIIAYSLDLTTKDHILAVIFYPCMITFIFKNVIH